MVQAYFCRDNHGARSTKSRPNFSLCENYIFSLDTHGAGSTIYIFSLDTDGAGSTIVQALCVNYYFSLDTHGARSTKSRPNFSLCENYIFSLDTDGAGSTIVQALCVNYYFFT